MIVDNNHKLMIRHFQDGDKKEVKSLIKQIMSLEFQEDQAAYPTTDIENIETAYGQIGDAFFVAQAGAKIVGTVAIKKEDERVALLRRLFVDAEHRNRRIGMKLIDRALEFCREVGYEELIFKTTSRMKSAIQLCQKKGFVQRAKLGLGSVELLKFVLPLRDISHAVKS